MGSRSARGEAAKDPLAGHLDRIQIDAAGDTQEQIYDVAWSDPDTRQPDADGKVPPVGSTVDVENATRINTIGAPELIGVRTDPDFDPALRAFYYARILEIPTPRWTAYDRVKFDLDLPPAIPLKTQDRAYTSPIWYTPVS